MLLSWRFFPKAALPLGLVALFFSGCSVLLAPLVEPRPVYHLAYAEAAVQAASVAVENSQPSEIDSETRDLLLLAQDRLAQARSLYRLKNFVESRKFAVRARHLAEEAEFRALRGN